MDKILFENEYYYINKGKVYDSSFLELPTNEAYKILQHYFKSVDYKVLDEFQLLDLLKQLKTANFHQLCLSIIEYGLNKFSDSFDFYKTVFPIITSCYRAINTPQKAIDFWEKGINEPKASYIIRLAKFFNVTTDYLLGLIEFK